MHRQNDSICISSSFNYYPYSLTKEQKKAPVPSPNFQTFKEPKNISKINCASLCSLAGRYNNPTSTRFLAPIDWSKIPAQATQACEIDSLATEKFKIPSLFISTFFQLVKNGNIITPFLKNHDGKTFDLPLEYSLYPTL